MNKNPFFSVIIPVYNKLPHLERSVNSVLKQTYRNFELIIIDDASTDGSTDKLLNYNDPKIRLLRRSSPGPGGYAARNLGISQSKNEWICFLDADDEWRLDLLDTLKDTILLNKELECITWGWYNVNCNIKELDKTSILNSKHDYLYFELIDLFQRTHTIWTGAVAFTKDLLIKAGGFPEIGYKRGGDVDTWIRCLWHSKGNVWINRNLSFYYLDSVNMVTKLVQRESLYFFSPFLIRLIKESNDRKLISAIKDFQNERIYSTIRAQIIDRQTIDYKLLKKMNFSIDNLLLIGKLLYNRIKYSIKHFQKVNIKERLVKIIL